MKIKICIVDDHSMIIGGLQNILSNYPSIILLAAYTDGEQLINGLRNEVPDVILLDIQLPGKKGDELASFIRKEYPQTGIVVLTNFDNAIYLNAMLQQGVQGYLLKTASPDMLINAIETVAKGGKYIDPSIEEKIKQINSINKTGMARPLSEREKEILQLIVDGHTSKAISEKLFLSFHTVENYRARIFVKMNASNVAELIKEALILGLVK